MRYKDLLVAWSAVLLMLSGCSGHTPQPQTTPEIYDFTSEGSFPEVPAVEPAPPSSFAAKNVTVMSAPKETTTNKAASNTTRLQQGWRVQVFAGASEDLANSVRHQVQETVSETVYIDYFEPYYKVRVGDCEQRDTCDALQQRLHALGNESAWVVPSLIQP